MRLTVLQQQTKALQEERPDTGVDGSERLGEREAARRLSHVPLHLAAFEELQRAREVAPVLAFVR